MNVETLGPIRSPEELTILVGDLQDRFPDSLLLFRGQNQLYDTIRSGRSRPSYRPVPLVELGWSSLASRLLDLPINSTHLGLVQAILQHYGCATHYVDLTSDVEVAAWFATHEYSSKQAFWCGSDMRSYSIVTYPVASKDLVCVLVLAVPDHTRLQEVDRLVDLSLLPTEFLRPHHQNAWLLLDRPPTRPVPNDFWVATIQIESKSYPQSLPISLFPSSTEDMAFRTLGQLPFVQFPMAYIRDESSSVQGDNAVEGDSQTKVDHVFDEACFALRALDIPEYSNEEDHKWNDLTVYEPHPIRMWKCWCAELEEIHGGIKGNIRDTVKITITPTAKIKMDNAHSVELTWPSIDADGCFYTFAALDHDKAIEHGPPYYGVWLQKDRDMIVEVPMIADHKTLSVCAGHAYFLRNGTIERQEMLSSCKCGHPESHDHRVTSVLRLQRLVEEGEVILLPHPRFEQDWYFAITGDEATEMKPHIESAQIIHRAFIGAFEKPNRKAQENS